MAEKGGLTFEHEGITELDIARIQEIIRLRKELGFYASTEKGKLRAINTQLLEALEKIARGEGRYNRDPLEHCSNTVEDMQGIADAAIELARKPLP